MINLKTVDEQEQHWARHIKGFASNDSISPKSSWMTAPIWLADVKVCMFGTCQDGVPDLNPSRTSEPNFQHCIESALLPNHPSTASRWLTASDVPLTPHNAYSSNSAPRGRLIPQWRSFIDRRDSSLRVSQQMHDPSNPPSENTYSFPLFSVG